MELQRNTTNLSGCAVAFDSVKAGKNFFMIMLALMVLVQLTGFIMVQFGGVLDPVMRPERPTPTTAAAQEKLNNAVQDSNAIELATLWREILAWVLPAAKFFALVLSLLAVLTFMFAVKLAIVGRLGGINGFMGAFFWSLVLLAIVTPWQQVLSADVACGALYNLGELTKQAKSIRTSWGAQNVETLNVVLFYARFMAYPLVALLTWLVVMARFGRGYKDSALGQVATASSDSPSALT